MVKTVISIQRVWPYIKPWLLIFLVVYAVVDLFFINEKTVIQQPIYNETERVENIIIMKEVEGRIQRIAEIDSITNEEINAILDSGNVDESYEFVTRYLDERAARHSKDTTNP